MNKTVRLQHPLHVRHPVERLSRPQKCKLSQNIDLPAASLVLVKSKIRRFLCRLYYLSGMHDDKKIAYVDDSVELGPLRGDSSDVKWIQEIELVSNSSAKFKSIKVHLYLNINDINLDVIKKPADLNTLTTSIAKHYVFCADCKISCNRSGLTKIRVEETDVGGFGTIAEDGVAVILSILVDSPSKLGRTPLGGLDKAQESLETLINTNCSFMKHPESFAFKPACQALITGPVGTGKSSLVHQMANKLKCILFEIPFDVFHPLPGETEQAIERIFSRLKNITIIVGKAQLILVLIENLEIFCPKFNPKVSENSHSSRVSALIFALLDEITRNGNSMVIVGTTSKLESLNSSVRRGSRMGSCEIALDMPDELQRREIMKLLCNQISQETLSPNLLNFMAQSTPGFVGADLEVLCQFASRHLHTVNLEFSEANLQRAFEIGLKSVVPSVMRENLGLVTRSSMKLDSIDGMEEIKKYLITSVLGPLRHPEKFKRFGLSSPSGILLYGPSGCAKTTIVKCLAGETKMTLISVSAAEIYSPYVGEAEKFIVKLFNQARMNAPTILFFDEIDTIVGNRSLSGGSNDAHMRILSTLLTEIDGFSGGGKKAVLVIGATNKPQMIDAALMRPGRFDKLIHIPAPDIESRISILSFVAKTMPIAYYVDIKLIAERTSNFSGADLINLCNEAALCAATKDLQSEIINRIDFDDVLTYLMPSLSEKQIQFYKDFEKFHRKS